jgi:hypothetical protein
VRFKIPGDAGTYFVVQQPSTPLPNLRVYSLAGTLASKVRSASDVLGLSEPNCVFGVVDEPKHSVRKVSGASTKVKQHHVVMQERVALIATKSIEDGEEMLLSSSSLQTVTVV